MFKMNLRASEQLPEEQKGRGNRGGGQFLLSAQIKARQIVRNQLQKTKITNDTLKRQGA